MNDGYYPQLWSDQCATAEKDLIVDVDLDVPGIVSELDTDDSNGMHQDEATSHPRQKRFSTYACLILATLGLAVAIVATVVSSSRNVIDESSANDDGGSGKSWGAANFNHKYRVKKPWSSNDDDAPMSIVAVNGSPLSPVTTRATTTSPTKLKPTSPTDLSIRSSTAVSIKSKSTTTSSTVSSGVAQDDKPTCIPIITLKKKLMPDTDECDDGCPSQVFLNRDNAVVRRGHRIYFFFSEGGDWKESPNVFTGTSSSLRLTVSENATVVSESTMGDLNRKTYIIENKLSGDNGRKVRIICSKKFDKTGFGNSIGIDYNLMVIGAPEKEGGGAAYVYEFKYDDWRLNTVLPLDDSDLRNEFATRVSVMGDKVAVAGFNSKGHAAVFVYRKDSISYTWEKMEVIDIDRCEDGCDGVGLSVVFANEGDLMVEYPRKSSLYNFALEKGRYELKQETSLPTDYISGQVVVNSNFMAVGGRSNLHVFMKVQGTWTEVAKLMYTEELSGTIESVAFSDRNLMISSGSRILWYTLDGCNI